MTLRTERRAPLPVETHQQAMGASSTRDSNDRAMARPPRAAAASGDCISLGIASFSGPLQPASGAHPLHRGTPQHEMAALVAEICRSIFRWRFQGKAVTNRLNGIISPMLQSNSQSDWTNLVAPILPLKQDSERRVHHKAWICILFSRALVSKASISVGNAPERHRRVPAAAFESALRANGDLAVYTNVKIHYGTMMDLRSTREQLISWLSRC